MLGGGGGRVAPRAKGLQALALGAALAGAALVPLAIPYVEARQTVGVRSLDEVEFYSAAPRDYLSPHPALAMYKPLGRIAMPERALFPGIVVAALALVGLWPPLTASRLAYGVGLLFASTRRWGFTDSPIQSSTASCRCSRASACRRASQCWSGLARSACRYGIARLTRAARSRSAGQSPASRCLPSWSRCDHSCRLSASI